VEINPKASIKDRADVVKNPEGAWVWKDEPLRALLLAGLTLNLRLRRTFYYTDDERFENFVEALEAVYREDAEFLEALIPYLRLEHGRKLSPMLIMGYLLSRSRTWSYLPRFITPKIVDTPKRMAEAMAAYKLFSKAKSFASVPYRERFKAVLEAYDAYTLRKNRMRRRRIKLADLIKVFRPKPKDEEMSKLYKAIIENDSYASLKPTEHITALLSSTELTSEEKAKALEERLEQMPFNALVRNLSQWQDACLDVKEKIRKRFLSVLSALRKGEERAYAVINPFLLFDLVDARAWGSFGMLQDVVGELVDRFVEHWAKRINGKDRRVAVLVDVSGSMMPHLTEVSAILALISELYQVVKLGCFDNDLYLEGKIEGGGGPGGIEDLTNWM